MNRRYGTGTSGVYDDEPIWTRANSYDMRNKNTQMHYPMSQSPNENSNLQPTTIVHSSIKPVPDADIYK